jgi:hypothetical protein
MRHPLRHHKRVAARRNDAYPPRPAIVVRDRAMGLTLYAETLWISPYVFSSFVALREKRLAFDVTEV